jgi:hypothetical protein
MSSVKEFNMLRLHGGHEKTLYDSWRWASEPMRCKVCFNNRGQKEMIFVKIYRKAKCHFYYAHKDRGIIMEQGIPLFHMIKYTNNNLLEFLALRPKCTKIWLLTLFSFFTMFQRTWN